MLESEVVNVVVTADLEQEIDLQGVGQLTYGQYYPDVYPAAYIKLPGMSGKVTVFHSGKLISVGAKSESQATKDLENTVRYLAKSRLARPTVLRPEPRNLVTALNFRQNVDIGRFVAEVERVVYEPEIFPGAIYRMIDPKACALVFAQGKTVIAAKDAKTASRAIELFTHTIEKYLY
ncbi:MAG: hypothetical protein JRM77_09350 [Nitrososphaerota archaeon]|jgi:transcription initiation factor TFIID TATA-box-binding protein|nr:hypothetical protein [Nitrososphaerota archaeon]